MWVYRCTCVRVRRVYKEWEILCREFLQEIVIRQFRTRLFGIRRVHLTLEYHGQFEFVPITASRLTLALLVVAFLFAVVQCRRSMTP